MAITIDWGQKIINVPQADLTFVSGTRYTLDADAFRLILKDLEDDTAGIAFETTHRHNTQVVLSGVTYARVIEVINGYTISFENTGTPYTVEVQGANHNFADVTNFDGGMSMIVGNAAGLIVHEAAAGPTLVDANILSIDGSTTVPSLMRIAAETMLVGTVATVISNSELEITFSSFTTEETANLQGRRIVFTTGNLTREAARITAYDGQGASPAKLTVTSLSALPAIGDTLVVV